VASRILMGDANIRLLAVLGLLASPKNEDDLSWIAGWQAWKFDGQTLVH
jgi:hypothetical protein